MVGDAFGETAQHQPPRLHPTADVSPNALIGNGTVVWHHAQVREGAVVGVECILGKGTYVDAGVHIGDRCKLQNGVFVFQGFSLEDGVFLGPGVLLLNDKRPRSINADGSLKTDSDWAVSTGLVRRGAAVGGGSTVLPGVTVGKFAMIGAGSVVTHDVPDHGIVFGNPARPAGFACACGGRLEEAAGRGGYRCTACSNYTDLELNAGL